MKYTLGNAINPTAKYIEMSNFREKLCCIGKENVLIGITIIHKNTSQGLRQCITPI